MPSRIRQVLLISLVAVSLIVLSNISYGTTINYIYDDLNRLIKVMYDDRTIIEYTYDEVGNRLEKVIQVDNTPPTGSIIINSGAAFTTSQSVSLTLTCNDANGCFQMQLSNDGNNYFPTEPYTTSKSWTLPSGDGNKSVYVRFKDTPGNWSPAYSSSIVLDTTPPTTTASPSGLTSGYLQSVTLNCNDGVGSGCAAIYYSTDGSPPTILYNPGSSIVIRSTTTLKFFSRDLAGHSEEPKTEYYTIDPALCPNKRVKVGGASYDTIQSAYNDPATVTGSIIKCRDITLIENVTINKPISVTLEGGYDCAFTTTVGAKTTIRGSLTTTAGGGTTTVKNFVLDNTPGPDTTPPITTPTPGEGTYGSAIDVTLSCSDGSGSGCYKTYYGLNGLDPTTEYSAPIHISASTTLKFYSTDLASNNETVKIQNYTIGGGCSNPPVKIGSTYYNTLQAAYNAANNGDTIKSRNVTFNENLTINQNIGVTLEGGYDCEFINNTGGTTTIKGSLTTTSGGGTLTIRNFVLSN